MEEETEALQSPPPLIDYPFKFLSRAIFLCIEAAFFGVISGEEIISCSIDFRESADPFVLSLILLPFSSQELVSRPPGELEKVVAENHLERLVRR